MKPETNIKESHQKVRSCSGRLVHMRNFPMIIKHLIDDHENEVLKFALMLVDITLRLIAVEIRKYEIAILEDKIIEYLEARKDIFAEFPDLLGKLKPKEINRA